MVVADVRRPAGPVSSSRRPTPAPDAPAARRRPRRRANWVQTGLLALALLIALYGLHPLLQGGDWWFGGAAMIVIVLAVAALVRARSRSRALPPLAGAAAALLTVTPVFAPATALFGLIPTLDTPDALLVLVRRGLASIQEQSIPAVAEPGLMLLIVLPVAGLAVVADIVVLEWELPAFAAAPLLALMSVPPAVQSGLSDGVVWLLVAGCYLLLLRSGLRTMPRGVVIATGAIALVCSIFVPTLLPPVTPSDSSVGSGFGGRANPLLDLGTDLRQGSAVTVLEYSTEAATPYLRIASLSDFRGAIWQPDAPAGRTSSLSRIPAPEGLGEDVDEIDRSISVRVIGVGGRRLPLPYPASRVSDLSDDWMIDRDSLTATSTSTLVDGLRYDVAYRELEPTVQQLRAAAPADPTAFERYLAVPQGIDPVVEQTARRVVGDAPTAYDQAIALQTFFRDDFTYSEQTPVDDGYDGSGVDVLPAFLDKKSGYCVHFSSAMAVMARQLGIPSRVVVGYLPGTRDGNDDDDRLRYAVSSRELHAWPELYFTGIGWVRFEPTASRGDVPTFADADAPAPGADDEEPTQAPSDTKSPDPTPGADDSARPSDRPDSAPTTATTSPLGTGFLIALAVAVVLALTPAAVRQLLRARRFARVDAARYAAAAAWDEVRDTVRDVGRSAPPTETVGDLALRLRRLLPDETEALDRLQRAVEREAYGRHRIASVDAEDLRDVLRAIARTATFRERVRAVLLPPSLVQRVDALVRA